MSKKCLYCFKEFIKNHHVHKYCSSECCNKNWREKNKNKIKEYYQKRKLVALKKEEEYMKNFKPKYFRVKYLRESE